MWWATLKVILCLFLWLEESVKSGERMDRAVTIQYSPADKACIDDSDCVSLGRKYACFLYKCLNWVDSTPEHSHCQTDEECQKLVSMGEDTGMVGTFILDAKCYRHWNSWQVTKGVCFSSYSLSQCSSKRDCSDEDECCGSYCCPKPYFQQWQEFTCMFDQQCQFWNTGQHCCPNQQCCDTPREVVKERNDFHDEIHHKESYHAVHYGSEQVIPEKVENVTKNLQNETEVVYDDGVIEGISDYHGIADYGDEEETVKKEDVGKVDLYDYEQDYNNYTLYNETDLGNSTDNITDIFGEEYLYEDINTVGHNQDVLLEEVMIETKQDIKDYEANEDILKEGVTAAEIIDEFEDENNLEGIKDEKDIKNDLENYMVIDIEYYDYDIDNTSIENSTSTVNVTKDEIENDITESDDLDNFLVIGYEDYDNTSTINDTIYFETDIKLTNQEIEESDVLATIEGVLQKEDKYQTFEGIGDIVTFEHYVTETNEASNKEMKIHESSKDAIEELVTELAKERNLHKTTKDSPIEVLSEIDKNTKNKEVSLIIKSVIPPDNSPTFASDSSGNYPKVSRTLLLLFFPLFLDVSRIFGL